MTTMLLSILGLAVIAASALLYGSRRWQSTTETMRAKLDEASLPIGPKTYSADELIGLPTPVKRYFRTVLTDGQPLIRAVSMEQTGTIDLSDSGEHWKPFTSAQRVVAQRPGFDWDARIAIFPGLYVRVHDAYIAGEGTLHASLFGLYSLAYMQGTAEIAKGELLRFFAEAAWYPTAFLPSQGAQWKSIDADSAMATLKDGETTVELLFRFNENGLIDSMSAESRGRTIAGSAIPTPWEVRLRGYELRDGMRIPMEGEVAWILPGGPKPYFRGRLKRLRYEFAF